jgi:hypothetical protein
MPVLNRVGCPPRYRRQGEPFTQLIVRVISFFSPPLTLNAHFSIKPSITPIFSALRAGNRSRSRLVRKLKTILTDYPKSAKCKVKNEKCKV